MPEPRRASAFPLIADGTSDALHIRSAFGSRLRSFLLNTGMIDVNGPLFRALSTLGVPLQLSLYGALIRWQHDSRCLQLQNSFSEVQIFVLT